MSQLLVHMLPALTSREALAGDAVVVIDVLRATTTMLYALAAGAREVIPCLEVDQALRLAATLPAGQSLLGGERGGRRIEGFDLGNSPAEYTPERVAGKSLIVTTTNGTRALEMAKQARRVWIGGFVNAAALVDAIAHEPRLHLLCAGTDDHVTAEDALLAGCLAARLADRDAALELSDQAQLAAGAYRALARDGAKYLPPALVQALRACRGGKNLLELGLQADIAAAAELDKFNLTPELDIPRWTLRL